MDHHDIDRKASFCRLEAVAKQAGLGKSTILAWEKAGKFPRAVRLSATVRVWLQDDVDQWVLDQHKKHIQPAPIDCGQS